MNKIIYVLWLCLPNLVYGQKISEDNEVECGIFQRPHFYISEILESNGAIVDNTPTNWILVNTDGIFHKQNKPIISFEDKKKSEMDTLDYTNRRYLTFKFVENVYKKTDTIRITDAIDEFDNGYEVCVGTISGTFINGVKEGLWQKKALGAGAGGVSENYKNGLLHGVRTILDINGRSLNSTLFVEGIGNYYDYYHDTGTMAVAGFLVYGKRHGSWTYYNKESRIVRQESYEHGVLHGPFTIYDNAGNMLYETNFKNGTGVYCRYKNDILMESGSMVNGSRIGDWEELRIIRNSSSPHYEIGLSRCKNSISYTEKSPINDQGSIVDVMFFNGDYIYIRATRIK